MRTVRSIAEHGTGGLLVDVECHLSNSLPGITIVGFANKAVDEAKERVRSAFAASNLSLPRKKITINLAPADLPKDSTSFDLAIAVAILQADNQVQLQDTSLFIGELGLKGAVRPVRGIIGKVLAARNHGYKKVYVPAGNLQQALLVPSITVVSVAMLFDLYQEITGAATLPKAATAAKAPSFQILESANDFSEIVGQARAKRALEIAAAGGHNVLLNGPPGTGKSMLAKALPSILPDLSREEILETTQIHSLSAHDYETIVTVRPFRAPHHSASLVSLVGGGQHPKPGEVSLAHNGVLFLDELPEFSKHTLEALRQPLEDKKIAVTRAQEKLTFPANFMLVATANPCPCGYFGTSKPCTCTTQQVVTYQRKLSGPILDRIDLYVDADEIAHTELLNNAHQEPSRNIKQRVLMARKRQINRYGSSVVTNAQLSNAQIKQDCRLDPAAKNLLDQAAEKLAISARSYMRVVKVARTIADLDGSNSIDIPHISEALQYRKPPSVTI